MTRYLRITALIIAGEMIFALPFHVQRFFKPTLLEAFEVSNTQLGDMFAVYGVTAMASYLLGGPFADRYPARSLLALSLVLTAIGGLYMATYPGVWQMSALYGYWGATSVFLFWAALIKATREWGGDNSQGIAFGILDGGRGFAAAAFSSAALGLLAVNLPTESALITNADRQEGLRMVILYFTAITFASAALVWFLIPEPPTSPTIRSNPYAYLPEVMRRPMIWAQAGIIIFAYCGYKGIDNYALYAKEVLGRSEVGAAALATTGAYLRPVACVIAGLFADRLGAMRSILVLFVIVTAAYAVLATLTPDIVPTGLILANLFVTFFAVFALRGIYYALLEETRTPKHLTGTSVAVIAFVGYTPEIFFGPVTGRILDANPGVQGHLDYFSFLGATAVAGVILSALMLRLKRPVAAA